MYLAFVTFLKDASSISCSDYRLATLMKLGFFGCFLTVAPLTWGLSVFFQHFFFQTCQYQVSEGALPIRGPFIKQS